MHGNQTAMRKLFTVGTLLSLFTIAGLCGCTRHHAYPQDGVNVDVPGVHAYVPTRTNVNVQVP